MKKAVADSTTASLKKNAGRACLQRLPLSPAPGVKRTDLEALILSGSPVLGLRPMRAARLLTLKVPKPMICTVLSFLIPLVIEPRTASSASLASFLEASLPRDF